MRCVKGAPSLGHALPRKAPDNEVLSGPDGISASGPRLLHLARFKMLLEKGHGSFGRVLLAWDSEEQRLVAMKTPLQGGGERVSPSS